MVELQLVRTPVIRNAPGVATGKITLLALLTLLTVRLLRAACGVTCVRVTCVRVTCVWRVVRVTCVWRVVRVMDKDCCGVGVVWTRFGQ